MQGNMRIRVEIASSLRDYRLINLNHKALAEEIGAEQDFNVSSPIFITLFFRFDFGESFEFEYALIFIILI